MDLSGDTDLGRRPLSRPVLIRDLEVTDAVPIHVQVADAEFQSGFADFPDLFERRIFGWPRFTQFQNIANPEGVDQLLALAEGGARLLDHLPGLLNGARPS